MNLFYWHKQLKKTCFIEMITKTTKSFKTKITEITFYYTAEAAQCDHI
jgi:hypothetical protein